MKNRKYNLLPYETIVKAAAGEPEAVSTVIQTLYRLHQISVLLSREYQRRYSRLPQSVLNGSLTQVPL